MKYHLRATFWNVNDEPYYIQYGQFCSIKAVQKKIGIKKHEINDKDCNIQMKGASFQIIRIYNYESLLPLVVPCTPVANPT